MSVLVTGAAGFIGSHLSEALLSQGREVVGLDNFNDGYARATKERNLQSALDCERFRLVEGDIRDEAVLRTLPEVTAVIHLAARAGVRPSIERPTLYMDVNVMGTARLLRFVRERAIGSFVFASSSSVYGNNRTVRFTETDRVDTPISPYAATKKAGELLCHTSTHLDGIASICLRFFTAHGPRQRPDLAIHKFARLLARGEAIPMFGDGSTSRDYTYVGDVVEGVARALKWAEGNPGSYEIVNLGGGRTIDLARMIELLGEAMGVVPRIQRLPTQPGDVDRTYADVAKARSLLGYDPKVEFEEGLRRFVNWLQGQPEAL